MTDQQKATSLGWSILKRLRDIRQASEADVVVVHREAFPLGSSFVERAMAATGTPMVFDFDDAIYLHSFGESSGLARFLKRPEKTGRIVELSTSVIAGNETLKAYASQFNGFPLPEVRVFESR